MAKEVIQDKLLSPFFCTVLAGNHTALSQLESRNFILYTISLNIVDQYSLVHENLRFIFLFIFQTGFDSSKFISLGQSFQFRQNGVSSRRSF